MDPFRLFLFEPIGFMVLMGKHVAGTGINIHAKH
jgi:hypothetical protein